MTRWEPETLTLTLDHTHLAELARLHRGLDPVGGASSTLVEAGLVGPGGVDELAGTVAVGPLRASVVERFDGAALRPLFVGWVPDGDATVAGPDADGRVVVTGTQLRDLPDLLARWTGLDTAVDVEGRNPVRTTTPVIDAFVSGAETTGEVTDATDEELRAVVAGWRCGWRATGSWGDADADVGLTVVDAGDRGLWRVVHRGRRDAEEVDVALVPVTVAAVLAGLGDVVTGRRSPRPESMSR